MACLTVHSFDGNQGCPEIRSPSVKSVRFSKVSTLCGRPYTYLLLMDPEKDQQFQTLVKAHRVMTVFQAAIGSTADHGEIGFKPGPGRQFLVFPISLREYGDRTVVGIKYDLLEPPELAEDKEGSRAAHRKARGIKAGPERLEKKHQEVATPKSKAKVPAEPKTKAVAKPIPKQSPPKKRPAESRKTRPISKVVAFPDQHKKEDKFVGLPGIKRRLRQVMKVLEQGKAVAAYHLLQEIMVS
jgi:hypothetical protein